MEANLVPGMSEFSSYFPRACELDNGLKYDEVIKLIIQQGLNRATLKPLKHITLKENYA